jgi:hypothetical protein
MCSDIVMLTRRSAISASRKISLDRHAREHLTHRHGPLRFIQDYLEESQVGSGEHAPLQTKGGMQSKADRLVP